MNKFLPLVAALFFLQLHENIQAQNIVIGTTAPQQKLHIAGGLRVDTLANGIDSGLLRHNAFGTVYTLKFNGDSTQMLRGNGTFGTSSAFNWSLKGNAGTNPSNNFIGTTDNQPLRFKTNNQPSGMIDPINFNIFFGTNAGLNNGSQAGNIALGRGALSANNTGGGHVAIGDSSLSFANIGYPNTA